MDERDRDIIPGLPSIPFTIAQEVHPTLSTATLREIWTRTNRLILVLRLLATGVVGTIREKAEISWWKATTLQRRTAMNLLAHWSEWADALATAPSASDAWRHLMGSRPGGYGDLLGEAPGAEMKDSQGRQMLPKGALAPVTVDEVSLPPKGTKPVDVTTISDEVAEYFRHLRTRMLHDADHLDFEAIQRQKVYEDPALKPKAARLHLAMRLWESGMLDFCEDSIESVRLFGVIKKYDENKNRILRPVWDERRPNLYWRPPPFVPLGSPACFTHVDLSDLREGEVLLSTTGDIPDMFSRMATPKEVWPFFTLEGITAQEFVDYMKDQGVTVHKPPGAEFVAICVLVMGWSWAPYIAHTCLMAILERVAAKENVGTLIYGVETPQLLSEEIDDGHGILTWGYIDDFGGVATSQSAANPTDALREWKTQVKNIMRDFLLPVHKETEGEGLDALGAVLTARPYRIRVPMAKSILLLLVTEMLVTTRLITVKILERVVGIWGWVLMFARPGLSLLDRTYATLREHQLSKTSFYLPTTVRNELQALAAMLPLFYTNLETAWSEAVFMTDSSDSGYGVCETRASRREIRAEARYCELRGFQVALEDEYAAVEESMLWDDKDDPLMEPIESMGGSPEVKPEPKRTFRVLHLFSGFRRLEDLEWWIRTLAATAGLMVEVWSIDTAISPDFNLSNVEFVELLAACCRMGIFHLIMAGPPCSTWSKVRHLFIEGGPRPLRLRSSPWGRTDVKLTKRERAQLDLGSALLQTTIYLMKLVVEVGGLALLEHPRDPGSDPYPSIWNLPLIREFLAESGGRLLQPDQCMLGSEAQKKTTIGVFGKQWAQNPQVGTALQAKCTHKSHSVILTGITPDGLAFKSSGAQSYPSTFCKALATTMIQVLVMMSVMEAGPDPSAKLNEEHRALCFERTGRGQARGEQRRGDRVRVPPMSSQWTPIARWKVRYAGKWRQREHTNVQETRCVVGLLRHLSRSSRAWGKRYLIFVDSMVALGALSKGRSSAPALLRLCRQAAAVMLTFGIRGMFRYVASEINVADGPSRGLRLGIADETEKAHAERAGRVANTRDGPTSVMISGLAPRLVDLQGSARLRQLLRAGREGMGVGGG